MDGLFVIIIVICLIAVLLDKKLKRINDTLENLRERLSDVEQELKKKS